MSGSTRTSAASGSHEREVVITRLFDAPPEVVFAAWTDPEQLARWWGPDGFTNPVCELGVRLNGAWHIVMRAPDGTEYPCRGNRLLGALPNDPVRHCIAHQRLRDAEAIRQFSLGHFTSPTLDQLGPHLCLEYRLRSASRTRRIAPSELRRGPCSVTLVYSTTTGAVQNRLSSRRSV
jgi:hypothetical protein